MIFRLIVVSFIFCCYGSALPQSPITSDTSTFSASIRLAAGAICVASSDRLQTLQNSLSMPEVDSPPTIPRSERTTLSSFKPIKPTAELYPSIQTYYPEFILTFLGHVIANYDNKSTSARMWSPVPNAYYAFEDSQMNLRFWIEPIHEPSRPLCWYDVDKALESYAAWICDVRRRGPGWRWAENFFEYRVDANKDVLLALGGLARADPSLSDVTANVTEKTLSTHLKESVQLIPQR